jgi:hypothetical protein
MIGAAHRAVDGTGHADACRHDQHALAGVGQENDGAAHRLHDGTKCVGGIVLKRGHHRQLARPLAAVHDQDLTALDVLATCCPLPAGSEGTAMAAQRLARRHKRILQWWATAHQRTRGMLTSSHQDVVRALPGDQGNSRHRLHTLAARGLMVIGRSPGGKAEAVWLTSEGQRWASPLAGSCDEGETHVTAMGYRA